MSRIITITASAFCLCGALAAPAFAQTTPQADPQAQQQTLSPTMKQDIEAGLHYPLPADFMPRAAETLQAIQAANIRPPNSAQLSLQQTIGQIAAPPGVPAILSAPGFTPESLPLGMTAFGITLAATTGQPRPAGLPAPTSRTFQLFHAHPEHVTALMHAIGTPPGRI